MTPTLTQAQKDMLAMAEGEGLLLILTMSAAFGDDATVAEIMTKHVDRLPISEEKRAEMKEAYRQDLIIHAEMAAKNFGNEQFQPATDAVH